MSKRAVFRADASPSIGGGHIMRCLTLARALIEKGWTCGFAVGPDSLHTVPALASADLDLMVMNGTGDSPAVLSGHWPEGVDWLIADHYGLDEAYETACRPWAKKILVIDDLADRRHDGDVLVDQTLGRKAEDYAGLIPSPCETLMGPRFALLRPQFASSRAAALERRVNFGGFQRILISMGRSDPHGVTARVMKGIDLSGVDVRVDVVVGADEAALGRTQDLAARLSVPVTVHGDVDDMAGLMAAADLAVGAGGGTSWERCCLGLPGLLIVTADNQRLIASALEQGRAVEVLGSGAEVDEEKIAAVISRICAEPDRLRIMSAAAADICDGQGVDRVREHLS